MIEFVMVASLLFFLLFGIMEFGFMLSTQLTLTSAAHQGARAAALGKPAAGTTTSSVEKAVKDSLAGLNLAYVTPSVGYASFYDNAGAWTAWTPGVAPPGGTDAQIKVVITYTYHTLTFVGNSLPGTTNGTRTMTGQAIMRYGG